MARRYGSFHNEGVQLRNLAKSRNCIFILSDHARQRMAERNVSRLDIESILQAGAVVEVQPEGRLRVQGRDRHGRLIDVIAVPDFDEIEIIVVTVIEP